MKNTYNTTGGIETKTGTASRAGVLQVILGASCWGLIGLFTRPLSAAGCSAVQIAFLRCGLSALLLWLYLAVFNRGALKIALRDIWMFFGTGVLSLVLFSVMYFTTQQRATLSIAAVLLYTSPCFVMLMSALFFKEKITGRMLWALLLAFTGCVCTTGLAQSLFTGGGLSLPPVAILTGIGSGFGYALYSIFANMALKKYSSITVTAYTLLFAALALAPFCLGAELWGLLTGAGDVLPITVGLSLVSTILPYALYTLGLKNTSPGRASVLAFAEPLVATLISTAVFHESLTAGGVVGILLIFLSIFLLSTEGKAAGKNKTEEA